MKAPFLIFPFLPVFTALTLEAQSESQPPPPVAQGPASANNPFAPPADIQRVYGPTPGTLIARETANGILENFHKVYAVTDAPRVVIYVNRELVDLDTGLKLTGHTEKYETTTSSAKHDME